MKKHFLKSFALLAMLFSALTLSAQSGVDWSTYEFLGDGTGGSTYSNKYKVAKVDGMTVVNIQAPGGNLGTTPGIYVSFEGIGAIVNCDLESYNAEGGGMIMHLSSFTSQETKVTVNCALGSKVFWVYYADGTTGGSSEPVVVESNYCQKLLTNGDKEIYVTAIKTAENVYQLIVEGEKVSQITGTHYNPGGIHIGGLTPKEKTTGDYGNKVVYEFELESAPTIYNALYVLFEGSGDLSFGNINDIVWGTCPEPVEDNESPVMTSASVVEGSITHNSVQIAVAASDNVGVTKYVIDDKSYTATDGKITVKDLVENTSYTLTVYAQDAAGNKSATGIDVTFTTAMPVHVCFGSAGHFGTPTQKKVFYQFTYSAGQLTIALKSLTGYNLDFAEVQIIGVGNYGMTSDGNGGYTHSLQATENSILNMLFLYSDTQMPGNEMTAQNLNANDANIISYYVGGCEPVAIEKDVNFALASNGASATASSVGDVFVAANAIDGNSDTRWASDASDPQWLIVDFGQRRVFNTVKLDHEGAWIKTFDIAISDDGINFVPIKSIVDQTATLTNNHYSQEIYLGADYTAQYVKMDGKARGTGYGYSLWEFEVYYPGTATLTSIECTASDVICKVGETLSLTSVAKDQHGNVMNDQTFTYTVTPADAGSVEGNTYKALKFGDAKIIATCGELTKEIAVINYAGDNVALNKEAVAHTGSGLNDIKLLTDGVTDGGDPTQWQGDLEPGDDRDVTCGFTLDLGMQYDLSLVAIYFEGACSEAYTLETSADNTTWATAHSFIQEGIGINKHVDYLYNEKLNNAGGVRYIRFTSTKNSTQWGMKIFEFQVFGTESASLTKAVSASVNDAAMGTATVTQNGVAVTEVETGSEVTFTATANEGYIFVNWSNGNTNPSFTTTVNAAMNLTANFRALGNIYCNTEMTVDGHTIYVTMKRSAPETYQLIVRSEENLTNFGGTNFYRSNNIHVIDLRDQGVLSEDKHILTATFTAETAPYMGSPLFVIFEGIGEKTYPQLTNIEYDVECSEDVTVTGLALNPATVSIVLGDAQTLKPIFTPAHAFDNELDWTSSNESVVTVDANGVVTAIAEGEAIITATLVSNPAISATCEITVEPISVKTWWGGFKTFIVDNQEYNVLYSFTRNEDRTITYSVIFDKDASAIGVKEVNVAGVNHALIYDNASRTASYTSTTTHSSGEVITGYFYFGIVLEFNFSYIVGSSNERPNPSVESVTLDVTNRELLVNDQLQLTATVNPGYVANKAVTWSSSADDVATVDANGLVTAKSAGTATITVTTADGGKTATCIVNVVDALTDATFYASGWFKENVYNNVGINYSITRTADRKLRYDVKINSNVGKLDLNVVDLEWHVMEHDAATNTYTYTTTNTYTDGEVISVFLRHGFAGGEGRWDFNYTVGSTNSPVRTMVGINDQEDNQSTRLAQYTSPVDVVIARSFSPDYWQTITLPFTLNAAQITEIFGAGTQVLKLAKAGVAPDQAQELGFSTVNSIQASTPYLIKPGKTVGAGSVLRNVTLSTTLKPVTVGNVTMHPLLNQIDYDYAANNVLFFLGNDSYLHYQANNNTILGLRAYFTFDGITTYAQAAQVRARVVFNENEATGFDNLTTEDAPTKIVQNGQLIIIRDGVKYNVQGQVIR